MSVERFCHTHVVYGMGQEVLFWKIEKISINYWFLRLYTYNLVKIQILGNFKWILFKKANIQKHFIAHAQYVLNFLDKMQVLDDKAQTLNFA